MGQEQRRKQVTGARKHNTVALFWYGNRAPKMFLIYTIERAAAYNSGMKH